MRKLYVFFQLTIALLCLSLQTNAATINWTGIGSGLFGGTDVNNWYNTANWQGGVVPGAGDDVMIGVNSSYSNSPLINASTTIKSLTFGALTSSGSLTINSSVILTVTGDISLKYRAGNNSPVTININGQTVSSVLGGTINCGGSFNIGDSTPPAAPVLSLITANVTNNTIINMAIGNFNVSQNVVLNSTSTSGVLSLAPSSNVNNPALNLNSGNMTIKNILQMIHSNYVNTPGFTILIITYPAVANNIQVVVNPSATLTLLSDASGSATVSAIPIGASITGNVNVQRFYKGSSTDLSKRGYRLISSPVYTGNPSSTRCYDLNYLLTNSFISGAAGGGFNLTATTSPSLYLYREDIVPNNAVFTSGNFKSIAKMNNPNPYDIGTQKRLTTTNVADTTTNIPVGNGVMYFFRGDKTDNSTQIGNKYTQPFDYPEDVTYTQTGQLNTGTVNVKLWFRSDNNLSFTNSPTLNNATIRGFTLVGNPYASTINWEKFNRNGVNSSIYGANFPAALSKIWVYNSSTKQYDTYMQTSTTISTAADTSTTVNPPGSMFIGAASNMIASGQGFFIRTANTGQTLTFRETAKTNTQPTAANLIKLMTAPQTFASLNSAPTAPASSAQAKPMLRFKLMKDSINTDEVLMAFNNTTTNKFSETDDAEDLGGNGPAVSLSLRSSDSVNVAIKQLQLPQKTQQVIGMLADATTTGLYQLKLTQISDLPPSYQVWLKDGFTNDSLDIRNNNTYNFNIDKTNVATFGINRFKIVIRQDPALTMHLLDFSAWKLQNGSQLTWKTENESSDYTFTIQRSIDNGKTFIQLDNLKSSGIGDYSFVDAKPVTGSNQYRIKLEDMTGNISYTKIETLMYNDTPDQLSIISIYPNPATDVVNVKMPLANNITSSYTIKILSSSGTVLKQVTSSQPNWQENVSNLLPGTYIVQVVNNRDNKIQGRTKFVKL